MVRSHSQFQMHRSLHFELTAFVAETQNLRGLPRQIGCPCCASVRYLLFQWSHKHKNLLAYYVR